MKVLKLSLLALGMGLSGLAQADVIGVKGVTLSYWAYDGQGKTTWLPRQRQVIRTLVKVQPNITGNRASCSFIPMPKFAVNLKTQTENEVAGQPVYTLTWIMQTSFSIKFMDNIVNACWCGITTTLNSHVTTLALSKTDVIRPFL